MTFIKMCNLFLRWREVFVLQVRPHTQYYMWNYKALSHNLERKGDE